MPAPTTVPAATATTAIPSSTAAVVGNGPPIGSVVNVGDAKPLRFYDPYLAAALADIQAWWAGEYARLYGEAYTPLAGGIFAAYPERTDPIPGCGFPGNTSYQEVSDYGAFYCPDGDYMAYDDGDQGVIFQLAETYSPSVVAVVMAHEFGHAIQSRLGVLDRDVATIYTEQQADCWSGAWARRVWEGQVPGLAFGDEDIRTGLVALVRGRRPDRHQRARAGRPRLGVRPHRRLPGGLPRRRRQLRRPHRQAVAAAAQRVHHRRAGRQRRRRRLRLASPPRSWAC